MLRQMSEKGADARQGWASSRSSSGEGPDELGGSVDGHAAEPFSPSYDTSAATATTTTTTTTASVRATSNRQGSVEGAQKRQDSFSWLDKTTTTDKAGESATTPTSGGQYQGGAAAASAAPAVDPKASDLRSKLRELDLGSLDLSLEDG